MKHVIAVDIGGSKIAILAGPIRGEGKFHFKKMKTPEERGVAAILRLLDDEIEAIPGGRASMSALGLSVPGHVDTEGRVLEAGNLDAWRNIPLRAIVEKRYGVPVFVDKDANCGALAEKWCGAAAKMRTFVFLALGTGVGAALFLEGRLYRGAHCAAGEAGDMSFLPDGERERTVSEVLGKKSIKKRVRKATGKKMSAADALAKAGSERRFERATRDVVEVLSASVIAISSLLDPEAIVFGGGTSNAGEALLSRVRERVAPRLAVRPRLLLSRLGPEAQLVGAMLGAAGAIGRSRQLLVALRRRRRNPAQS